MHKKLLLAMNLIPERAQAFSDSARERWTPLFLVFLKNNKEASLNEARVNMEVKIGLCLKG